MSNYQEASGTITLPRGAGAKVRTALAKAHNQVRDDAVRFAETALKNGWVNEYGTTPEAMKPHQRHVWGSNRPVVDGRMRNVEQVADQMIRAARQRVKNPKRIAEKDYPKANSKTVRFSSGDLTVDVRKDTVHIDVDYNNRSVERATETELWKALNTELDRVDWKRNSGGVIRYTDEYARDAAMEHGGNPMSLMGVYGPKGEAEETHRLGWSPTAHRRLEKLASVSVPAGKRICGNLMPRKQAMCTRPAGHTSSCQHNPNAGF